MLQAENVISALRARAPELTGRFGVQRLSLFGSVARGEETPDSDIDLLVTVTPDVGLLQFLELEEYLTAVLGGRVDVVSERALKPAVRRNLYGELRSIV